MNSRDRHLHRQLASCRQTGSQLTRSAFVRTHLPSFAKRRERAYDSSSRFHHLCRFISWESEELDERPYALFLMAGRKSLSSC